MNDSILGTINHIKSVQYFLNLVVWELIERSRTHDQSKLESPEKEVFDKYAPLLVNSTYGSDEYRQSLKEMEASCLDHHYKHNRHHPQNQEKGIDGMNLIDLIEMSADWISAVHRHKTGNIEESIEINTKRFNLSPQLVNILKNTVMFFKTHE